VTNGDVPGGSTAGGDGDEATWQDLIARFGAPAPADDDAAAPWPERENLAGPVHATPIAPEGLPREPPTDPSGMEQPWPQRPGRLGPRDVPAREDPGHEHYTPPPPPPLPKLNPVTKGAWLALFGGPFYLLVATAAGWTVSGFAAFASVAAFVGGFAVLVLRMDGGGPPDSGPDDGAVV
jgi:hypothetical protein